MIRSGETKIFIYLGGKEKNRSLTSFIRELITRYSQRHTTHICLVRSLSPLLSASFSMIVCMIAAMSSNRVIGKNNKLPRHLPEDLKRFKAMTMGSTIMMGRTTYESIGSKSLPGRKNVVISSTKTFPEATCFNDPEVAFATLDDELGEHEKLFIIGGASLYSYFLDRTERIYLTEINDVYTGDTFFPEFEDNFDELERITNPGYDFVTWRKKRAK